MTSPTPPRTPVPPSEQAYRAYPIEAEQALQAWIDSHKTTIVGDAHNVSRAGWWYAAWMHRQAEVDRLTAEVKWWREAAIGLVEAGDPDV